MVVRGLCQKCGSSDVLVKDNVCHKCFYDNKKSREFTASTFAMTGEKVFALPVAIKKITSENAVKIKRVFNQIVEHGFNVNIVHNGTLPTDSERELLTLSMDLDYINTDDFQFMIQFLGANGVSSFDVISGRTTVEHMKIVYKQPIEQEHLGNLLTIIEKFPSYLNRLTNTDREFYKDALLDCDGINELMGKPLAEVGSKLFDIYLSAHDYRVMNVRNFVLSIGRPTMNISSLRLLIPIVEQYIGLAKELTQETMNTISSMLDLSRLISARFQDEQRVFNLMSNRNLTREEHGSRSTPDFERLFSINDAYTDSSSSDDEDDDAPYDDDWDSDDCDSWDD